MGVFALGVAASLGVIGAPSATAQPSVASVQAQVTALYHQAEVINESYDKGNDTLAKLRSEVKDLSADAKRQDASLGGVRDELRDNALRQFEGSSLSEVGAVVVSDNPAEFLSQLSAMSAYQDIQSKVFADYDTQVTVLELRQQAVNDRLKDVAATEKQLAKDKAQIAAKLAKAKALLTSIGGTMPGDAPSVSRNEVRLPNFDVPATGAVGAALKFAMSQVGGPYAYGGIGNLGYDCSGLTMVSFSHAGIALPPSASAQYGYGTHVSVSNLQPGDLVFYYSPISHVGIYIGHGMIVNAEDPAGGVRVQPIFSMPYVGATRVG